VKINRRHLLSLLPALPAVVRAQSSNEPGWTALFDGRSLDGWSIQDGPESAFYVAEGVIAGSPSSGYPAWLRSNRRYENFDLEFEWMPRGWSDGGLYFCAPEHGSRSRAGFKLSLFHQSDTDLRGNSSGAIFPTIAPKLVNVRPKDWNAVRVKLDWPSLEVWYNGEQTHKLDAESHRELRHRLRSGYLGLETLTYPLKFRNLRIRELPAKEQWAPLYSQPSDLDKWTLTELNQRTPAQYQTLGHVLRGDGLGNLTTKEKYRDFELQMYFRGALHHNGGVLFRGQGGGGPNRYEIQLHDVEEAHYPTGSLYFFKRSTYPRIEPEKWCLFQLLVKDRWCLVRINGDDVMEYEKLENLQPGPIELQAHQAGRWIEYKRIRVRML
jgi:hypothetical protein